LVECHCNAFNEQATGTEVLYAAGSTMGAEAAQILQRRLMTELGLPDRGLKPRNRGDRGGYLLWGVSQVALIPEPAFIDNDGDLARMRARDLPGAYADAIERILKEVL
jgi:N-acetylmuramoyl-L-alanine amidase